MTLFFKEKRAGPNMLLCIGLGLLGQRPKPTYTR